MFATLLRTGSRSEAWSGALQADVWGHPAKSRPGPVSVLLLGSRMARATKTEAGESPQKLLDAAADVFRERGVAHSTLAEVAAAAGVTRGAVYWHFRDKAHLFDALCAREPLPMEAMLACAGEVRQQDPLGALRTLAVNGLVRLATNARTQAVFDVIFHKCEFAAEFASVAGRRHATDTGCLANVERLLKQAVDARQLPGNTDTEL